MSWFRLARRGAAYEFGRRLWRWFLAFEIIRWFCRHLLAPALFLTALTVAAWATVQTPVWWLPLAASLLTAASTAAVWGVRRYWWELRAVPRPAVAAAVVALVGFLGAAIWWLR